MAILRSIALTVTSEDDISVDEDFAGYEGEHAATEITVTVPAAWDGYDANLCWQASDGFTDESPDETIVDPTGLSFAYALPYNAMKPGVLRVAVSAKTTVNGEVTFKARTMAVELHIAASVNPDPIYASTYTTALEEANARIDQLILDIADHEARIAALENP